MIAFRILFILLGSGANGKLIFLQLLEALVGAKNTSHESLQKLQENTFSLMNLYGTSANIYADLKSSVIEFDEVFKAIIGGDVLSGERKYQHAFSFHNTARLVSVQTHKKSLLFAKMILHTSGVG